MVTVVIPFRGEGAKSRLGRPEVARAMLEDVRAAAEPLGRVIVANGTGGQGEAVGEALAGVSGAALVVNADLPCATPDDLRALLAATPPGGVAIAVAADGTTNAVSLADAALFEPLYGPGSATRYLERGAVAAAIPNLADDVDTPDDLRRIGPRAGAHTRGAL